MTRRDSLCAVRTALIVAAAAVLPAFGQTPPAADADPGFVIRTETNLVLTPFHVMRKKKYVEGISPDQVRVFEDGREQQVALFEGPAVEGAEARRTPVEIILLLDVSLSVMNRSLLDVHTLKEELLDDLDENVSIGVYAFANKLTRLTRPTRDLQRLQAALDKAYELADGGTRLYEAVMQTCRDASQMGPASRFLLVLSDGFPTGKAPPDYAVHAARAYGIPVYPVILGHQKIVERSQGGGGRNQGSYRGQQRQVWGNSRAPRPGQAPASGQSERLARARAQEERMAVFADIGGATGGQAFDPPQVSNKALRRVFRGLAEQVKAEYLIGYYPDSVDDEKTPHQVELRLSESVDGKMYGGARVVVH